MPDLIFDLNGDSALDFDMNASDSSDFDYQPYSKGDPGESTYQIAVDNGFAGTEEDWLASLVGNGVASVTLISTVGKTKTYRMLFTDGTYTDYNVEDGADGIGGGTLTQVTFNGTVVSDDGTGNVTLSESDPVFTASDAYGISSTDISNWNGKGTYSKPSGGIPKTDLENAVQTSLGKADTALQSYTETDPVFTASDAYGITSSDISNWNGKGTYSKPIGGIPASDLADYYAASPSAGGPATYANAIHYGAVDNTSTSTAFTATISGITSYYDGLTVLLKNGVVTSAAGFTIDINGLGAKGAYSNMAAATAETTIFNANYTMLFVYDSTRVAGGCWICYRGYNSDNNTIGYQLRTNSTVLKTTDRTRYYRLLFTSADGTKWVPANTKYDNSATSVKTVNSQKINPFGRIVYLGNSTNYNADTDIPATAIWQQYVLVLGYSFNNTGVALTLTTQTPVYVKAAPQSDGSAIIDSTTPFVQTLPSTEDGKIYIYLGIAYDATHIELQETHPVYYYKDSAVRLWTNAASSGGGAVDSVNGQTGTVVLDATDVGALPDSTAIDDVYWCTYNTTTSAEIETALTAGKIPMVKYQDYVYTLRYRNSATNHRFICNYGGKEKTVVCQSGVWAPGGDLTFLTTSYTAPVTSVNGQTGAVTGLQTTSNLVTSVSAASTNSQYPSAKLLYDTIGDIETLLASI